jgi:uncharacterized protein YndB with AHSA1/START domain
MTQPLPISASVDIEAPTDQVWAAVGDVTRMGEWSPECRRVIVLGGRGSGVGTRMLGMNRRGWVVWPTTSTVVRHEPGVAVAWRTRESGATWSYHLEPTCSARSSGAPAATTRSWPPGSARHWSGSRVSSRPRRATRTESAVGEQRGMTRGSDVPSG